MNQQLLALLDTDLSQDINLFHEKYELYSKTNSAFRIHYGADIYLFYIRKALIYVQLALESQNFHEKIKQSFLALNQLNIITLHYPPNDSSFNHLTSFLYLLQVKAELCFNIYKLWSDIEKNTPNQFDLNEFLLNHHILEEFKSFIVCETSRWFLQPMSIHQQAMHYLNKAEWIYFSFTQYFVPEGFLAGTNRYAQNFNEVFLTDKRLIDYFWNLEKTYHLKFWDSRSPLKRLIFIDYELLKLQCGVDRIDNHGLECLYKRLKLSVNIYLSVRRLYSEFQAAHWDDPEILAVKNDLITNPIFRSCVQQPVRYAGFFSQAPYRLNIDPSFISQPNLRSCSSSSNLNTGSSSRSEFKF